MSILNYADYFERFSKIVWAFNQIEFLQKETNSANYPLTYIKNELQVPFSTQLKTNEIDSLESTFNAVNAQLTNLKSTFKLWCDAILKDLGQELGEYQSSTDIILQRLIEAMKEDSQTIYPRYVQIDSNDLVNGAGDDRIKSDATGTGALVFTFRKADTSGDLTQLPFAEIMQCRCISATTPNKELFVLSGEQSHSSVSPDGQGSGSGPSIQVSGLNLRDGGFESWTSGTPAELSDWTLSTGTWGTDILQDSSNPFTETYCIKIPAQKSATLTQTLPSIPTPQTFYAVGIWIRSSGGTAGTGDTLTLSILDTNGNALDDKLTVDLVNDVTTTYKLFWTPILMPGQTTNDMTLQIKVTLNSSSGTNDYFFDFVQYGKMVKHNNIFFNLFAGDVPFQLNDRFGYASSSDHLGFKVELQPINSNTYTAASTSTQNTIVISGSDVATSFPVNGLIQHPTDKTWHRITASSFVTDTTITVTPSAVTSWASQTGLHCVYNGKYQEFFGRLYTQELPASTTVSTGLEDPV